MLSSDEMYNTSGSTLKRKSIDMQDIPTVSKRPSLCTSLMSMMTNIENEQPLMNKENVFYCSSFASHVVYQPSISELHLKKYPKGLM